MSPKLKALLARIILVGGIALVASYVARRAPREQTLAIRAGSRDLMRVDCAITRLGDDEPTAGFSQTFSDVAPRIIRHEFSAQNGNYTVVITFNERTTGEPSPIRAETTFERQVSLVGGEVIISPD